MFLLITFLNRWLPASGAMVKPVLRTLLMSVINSGVSVPARNDGREIAVWFEANASMRPAMSELIQL